MSKEQQFIIVSLVCLSTYAMAFEAVAQTDNEWTINSTQEWKAVKARSEGISFEKDLVTLEAASGSYLSTIRKFREKRSLNSITFIQSPVWLNWESIKNVGPSVLADAPVLLRLGDKNYWMFGRYKLKKNTPKNFEPDDATLEGFDIPLKTTPYNNMYNAPGGLKESLGGYHAWQSCDMKNWVHHGPVTSETSRWVTTAEQVDGKTYFYYDFPNDQDPHLYIDEDLTDGKPGQNMGMVFKDPSHGSDIAIIRNYDGMFHLIYEDWSPIDASKHSWDSPLAGHAVSPDGINHFSIKSPAVDERTQPTGEIATFNHPHWAVDDPDNYPTGIAEYEIHQPEQDAYGDWAAIGIGRQYYLFGDFHPAGTKAKEEMKTAWFTSSSLNEPFKFCGSIGQGHPDPDIIFAEERFYLVTQQKTDYVSTGPWVETVKARAGVDTDKDGTADQWTEWQEVKEIYKAVPGFSKLVDRVPAQLDTSKLSAGYGFCFEMKIENKSGNTAKPMLDKVKFTFTQ
ncbi:MAG: hypothetical protein AAF984_08110 [Verrucomicrobiota bacterium]